MIGLPRSTLYYCSVGREQTLSDADLVEKIREIQDELSGYGKRRVTRELRRRGHIVNKKRVERLMRAHGLNIKPKRRRSAPAAAGDDPQPAFANLYRNVVPAGPDVVWVADVTYIRLRGGFAYLAVILDACSRRVVGYAISKCFDAQLTLAALKASVESRKPKPGSCIHHSDRGIQYACARYRQALLDYGLIGSMSSIANPYDNAQAESFMKTFKVEEVYAAGYETYDDVVDRVPFFIDDVYNSKRLHSALGYLPPKEYEEQLARHAA